MSAIIISALWLFSLVGVFVLGHRCGFNYCVSITCKQLDDVRDTMRGAAK